MLHEEITNKVIQAFYKVNQKLGYGFLEKVYENAMKFELKKNGFNVEQQKKIMVYYESEEVGEYYADLVVDDTIIIELKAAERLSKDNEAQLINYLKSTKMEIGLLFNFGKKVEFRRKIFTNDRKEINPSV